MKRILNRDKVCTIVGCSKPVRQKGLCNAHRIEAAIAPKRINKCGCGCGQLTAFRFKPGHHTRLLSSEEQSRRAQFQTGDSQRDRGCKDTYRKMRGRHEHRRVMEAFLDRPLRSDEIVHHKNGKKKDNRLCNLALMTRAEHIKEHLPEMQRAAKKKKRLEQAKQK